MATGCGNALTVTAARRETLKIGPARGLDSPSRAFRGRRPVPGGLGLLRGARARALSVSGSTRVPLTENG